MAFSEGKRKSDGIPDFIHFDDAGNLCVRIVGIPEGDASASVQYNIDDSAGSTDLGTTALVVRVDTPAGITPANGDYTSLRVDANGLLWCNAQVNSGVAHDAAAATVKPTLVGGYASAAAPTSVSADGDAVDAWFLRNGSQVCNLAAGGTLILAGHGTAAGAIRVELPTDGTGVIAGVTTVTTVTTVSTVTAVTSVTNPVPGTTGHVISEVAVTTDGAYAANDIVGGILTMTTVNFASTRPVLLRSLQINDKGNNSAALHIYFFKATPAGGTYTNNGAVTWDAADSARKVGQISVAAGDWISDGSQCSVNISGIDQLLALSGTSLFALIIATGTPTFANGDLTLKVGLEQK